MLFPSYLNYSWIFWLGCAYPNTRRSWRWQTLLFYAYFLHYAFPVGKHYPIRTFLLFVTISYIILDKDLHKVTLYEKLFIMFGLAFVLAEYTATRENGWRSMYLIFILNSLFILVTLVYMANVTWCSRVRLVKLTAVPITVVECLWCEFLHPHRICFT